MPAKTVYVKIPLFTAICLTQKLWGFLHQDLPRLSVNSAQNIQKAPKLQLIITTISAVRAITYGNTELK